VAVTSEAAGPTEKWISEKGAKYGYAYDKGGKFMRACGVSGIPHAMLVDASGKVVFDGGPGQINEDMVRGALQGALKTPLWELPKPFSKTRGAIAKGDLATALKESDALHQDAANAEAAKLLSEAIKGMVSGTLAGADALAAEGDWLGADREWKRLLKSAKGLPEEATAKSKLAELAKNPEAKKGLKAQEAFEKLTAEPVKSKKDAEERVLALDAFLKKNEGTFAGKKALEMRDQLKEAISKSK
jgi:hypothetical protein